MSAARRWLWFVAALSLIAADVPPWHIVAAIKDGNSLAISAKNFHIEVAAPSMIVGAECSAVDPCWVAAEASIDVVGADGKALRSVGARYIITSYSDITSIIT